MHSIKTAFLLSIVVFLNISLFAQTEPKKETKKVVIIKKTDVNGKVNENRIEAEGDEAEKLIKEMELDGDVITIDKIGTTTKSTEKSVSITKDNNGQQKIVIITGGEDNDNVIEWSGKEEEMPANIKDMLKDLDVKTTSGSNGTKTITINTKEMDGNKNPRLMVIRGNEEEGDEPFINGNGQLNGRPSKGKRNNAMWKENDVTLGVMIKDDGEGVQVDDVVDNSAAAKAGIRRDDTILKVGDAYVFSLDGLLTALRPYKRGDKAKITYIRAGKEVKKTVQF